MFRGSAVLFAGALAGCLLYLTGCGMFEVQPETGLSAVDHGIKTVAELAGVAAEFLPGPLGLALSAVAGGGSGWVAWRKAKNSVPGKMFGPIRKAAEEPLMVPDAVAGD